MRRSQLAGQIAMPAFEEQPHVADRGGVGFVRRQSLDARPQAAVNVVLQAGMRVAAGEDPTLQEGTLKCRWMKCTRRCARLAGKVGAVIAGAILSRSAASRRRADISRW